jgi:hypothetical protein
VDEIGSESCLMAGFDISSVECLGSATRDLGSVHTGQLSVATQPKHRSQLS